MRRNQAAPRVAWPSIASAGTGLGGGAGGRFGMGDEGGPARGRGPELAQEAA